MPAPRAAIFTRVAIYNRISNDPQGIEAGVERQREDCHALADRLGWQVYDTYVDNDLSAWTGKRRPSYERMLADIRSGKVDAVIVWHEDRLTRLPRELEEFADACLKAGVHRLVSCYGDTDLTNSDDMLTLRIKGAVAKNQSDAASADCAASTWSLASSMSEGPLVPAGQPCRVNVTDLRGFRAGKETLLRGTRSRCAADRRPQSRTRSRRSGRRAHGQATAASCPKPRPTGRGSRAADSAGIPRVRASLPGQVAKHGEVDRRLRTWPQPAKRPVSPRRVGCLRCCCLRTRKQRDALFVPAGKQGLVQDAPNATAAVPRPDRKLDHRERAPLPLLGDLRGDGIEEPVPPVGLRPEAVPEAEPDGLAVGIGHDEPEPGLLAAPGPAGREVGHLVGSLQVRRLGVDLGVQRAHHLKQLAGWVLLVDADAHADDSHDGGRASGSIGLAQSRSSRTAGSRSWSLRRPSTVRTWVVTRKESRSLACVTAWAAPGSASSSACWAIRMSAR